MPFESTASTRLIRCDSFIVKISCATYIKSIWQIAQDMYYVMKKNINMFQLPKLDENTYYETRSWGRPFFPNLCETIPIDINLDVDNIDAEIKMRKEIIRQVLSGIEYGALSYIARETGFNIEEVKALVESDSMFRKSIIRTKTGGEVYMLNTKFSTLVDAWRAFRDFNAKVYY
jgi:hypothetical protein